MGIVSQPHNERASRPLSRLKLHLRLVTVNGYCYRVVTLRPSMRIFFSTNFFHETWHIVTSQVGSQLLARLLWGLSFERHPGTVLAIHNLLATPFEAERSDPILLVPAGLTRLSAGDLRILKNRLGHLGPPAMTIRWQTFGLDMAVQARRTGVEVRLVEAEGEMLRRDESRQVWRQERMERLGGFICYSAPPAILRQQALMVHSLRVRKGDTIGGMDYHFLARANSRQYADGEVQIFADYVDRVAAATQARLELVANPRQPVLSETVQEVISRKRDQIKARRRCRRAARRKLPAHFPG